MLSRTHSSLRARLSLRVEGSPTPYLASLRRLQVNNARRRTPFPPPLLLSLVARLPNLVSVLLSFRLPESYLQSAVALPTEIALLTGQKQPWKPMQFSASLVKQIVCTLATTAQRTLKRLSINARVVNVHDLFFALHPCTQLLELELASVGYSYNMSKKLREGSDVGRESFVLPVLERLGLPYNIYCQSTVLFLLDCAPNLRFLAVNCGGSLISTCSRSVMDSLAESTSRCKCLSDLKLVSAPAMNASFERLVQNLRSARPLLNVSFCSDQPVLNVDVL